MCFLAYRSQIDLRILWDQNTEAFFTGPNDWGEISIMASLLCARLPRPFEGETVFPQLRDLRQPPERPTFRYNGVPRWAGAALPGEWEYDAVEGLDNYFHETCVTVTDAPVVSRTAADREPMLQIGEWPSVVEVLCRAGMMMYQAHNAERVDTIRRTLEEGTIDVLRRALEIRRSVEALKDIASVRDEGERLLESGPLRSGLMSWALGNEATASHSASLPGVVYQLIKREYLRWRQDVMMLGGEAYGCKTGRRNTLAAHVLFDHDIHDARQNFELSGWRRRNDTAMWFGGWFANSDVGKANNFCVSRLMDFFDPSRLGGDMVMAHSPDMNQISGTCFRLRLAT